MDVWGKGGVAHVSKPMTQAPLCLPLLPFLFKIHVNPYPGKLTNRFVAGRWSF